MSEEQIRRRETGRPWARENGVASLDALRDAKAAPGYDGLTCSCGSAWFTVTAVTLAPSGRPTGWSGMPTCVECGTTPTLTGHLL